MITPTTWLIKEHFNTGHPLAGVVRRRCVETHGGPSYKTMVGCPPCWEWAIRQDAIAAAEAGADPTRTADQDPEYVDWEAVERYLRGHRHHVMRRPDQVAVLVAWLRREPDLTIKVIKGRTGWGDLHELCRAAAEQLDAEQHDVERLAS